MALWDCVGRRRSRARPRVRYRMRRRIRAHARTIIEFDTLVEPWYAMPYRTRYALCPWGPYRIRYTLCVSRRDTLSNSIHS